MVLNEPVAVDERNHCQVTALTLPSSSDSEAVSVPPPWATPEMVITPASSTSVTLIVMSWLASIAVSALPAAFFWSLMLTVTL